MTCVAEVLLLVLGHAGTMAESQSNYESVSACVCGSNEGGAVYVDQGKARGC